MKPILLSARWIDVDGVQAAITTTTASSASSRTSAVVDAAGPAPYLMGHSFGALCALEAALRTNHVARMVLYEPAFTVEGYEIFPPGSAEKFQGMLDLGDRDGLIESFFRDVVAVSDEEILKLRGDPSWAGRVASAHTLIREMADADYILEPARFRRLAIPTLLIVGERSPPFLRAASDQLADALPDARIVELKGQAHIAMTSAPDLFAREIIDFLSRA